MTLNTSEQLAKGGTEAGMGLTQGWWRGSQAAKDSNVSINY